MRSQGSAPELERRRELAVARVAEGYPQAQVSAFLGVHHNTVSRWVCTARDRGTDALKAKPTPGRPRKLTARQEKTVLGWVTELPTSFGFPTDLWTSRRLAALIEQRWGVHFQCQLPGGVAPCPRAVPAKARPARQGARRGGHRPLAGRGLATPAKKAREEKAHLVLIDESGLFLDPQVRRTWAPRGQDAGAAFLGSGTATRSR